jgi:hypothetical protein
VCPPPRAKLERQELRSLLPGCHKFLSPLQNSLSSQEERHTILSHQQCIPYGRTPQHDISIRASRPCHDDLAPIDHQQRPARHARPPARTIHPTNPYRHSRYLPPNLHVDARSSIICYIPYTIFKMPQSYLCLPIQAFGQESRRGP